MRPIQDLIFCVVLWPFVRDTARSIKRVFIIFIIMGKEQQCAVNRSRCVVAPPSPLGIPEWYSTTTYFLWIGGSTFGGKKINIYDCNVVIVSSCNLFGLRQSNS